MYIAIGIFGGLALNASIQGAGKQAPPHAPVRTSHCPLQATTARSFSQC
jgi:hypothetical protein